MTSEIYDWQIESVRDTRQAQYNVMVARPLPPSRMRSTLVTRCQMSRFGVFGAP